MTVTPPVDVVFKIRVPHTPGALAKVLAVIGEQGYIVGEVTTLFIGKTHNVRRITISFYAYEEHFSMIDAINDRTDASVQGIEDPVFERHRGGKIRMTRTTPVENFLDMRYIYTPGVARVCEKIYKDPDTARYLTTIGNTVGIFTNGTRVLGLGDIGVVASMPVMEGKSIIYDRFVGLSAVPILVDTSDPDEFIETVVRVAPTFAGIHLEDVRAPDCFYIEDELHKRLSKPVMHDDQHGTATVALAAVMSALRHVDRDPKRGTEHALRVAQIGLGAAGYGIARLMLDWGLYVIGVDPSKEACKRLTEAGGEIGTISSALDACDIVIATTGIVNLITPDMIRPGQIILALSNPAAEIIPETALAAGAAFAADGRVINNALAYPGLFKAAITMGAESISAPMKIVAAEAISELADEGELVPSPFHPDIHNRIVQVVCELIKR